MFAEILAHYSTRDLRSDCQLWTGYVNEKGYGRFNVAGKNFYAHRASWELANGPIPEGMCVCHRCDVPACIHPGHLFLGTKADNNADMREKGRQCEGERRKRVSARGERHGRTKLTADQVLAMRADNRSQRAIAAAYGVSQYTVNKILLRQHWGHV